MSSHNFFIIFFLVLVSAPAFSLNTDGIFLLSFKYSTLNDPLSVLESWNYDDLTPCSWFGVTCTQFRVTSLSLPSSQLLGSIPPDLGFLEKLQTLDLSNNFLNGSLPSSVFNSTELQLVSLSKNEISGELPESIGSSLRILNLSDNALTGKIPKSLTNLHNLSVISLRSNYFSGSIPSGFNSVEILDLSSNLLNGSLPFDFNGANLKYLNLSYNKLSGSISEAFSNKIPQNATIDLSFNNLTGPIPESSSLLNQKTEFFKGNVQLCGKPLKNLCAIPSTLSSPPNISTTSPAIAVIPQTGSKPLEYSNSSLPEKDSQTGLKPTTIVAISVADLAGITILALAILYVYHSKKNKTLNQTGSELTKNKNIILSKSDDQNQEPRKPSAWPCLPMQTEETSEESATSDSDGGAVRIQQKSGKLVMVDGETEMDMETLLKASAYILGASGSSIVYKAVLGDGTAFAVRRIGESGVGVKFKDFENQVRLIWKMRHPNLVGIRGFYWGEDEKLVIYDYVSNGSLASSTYRKQGSSPFHLPLQLRFKIATGLAQGLAFIHEKKNVHGSIKPTNILLNSDNEPIISDFGLDKLVLGTSSRKTTNSGHSHDTAGPHASPSSSITATSPYQAPESLKNLKPNPKWDVYSFGVILLELLTGRVFSDRELSQLTTCSVMEDKNRVLRLADVAVRGDVEAREDAVLACFKLGFSCASFLPQKRPSMKEAVQVLEKITL
ncbi:probable LRR receptor-like serine/threonine-protein kinase At4g37250 [Mercurialis annua]|uniref:probable LRR receptor-like serine/threonine-protein kinase At4g37250 n=1 Tax=Mercurialis annua TaxID=3986 RepID=UPI00215FF44A|nr:probable LRR receptor-like serine/threonine-protein kinase At4g37250 [Mercurialis annua]